MTSKEALAELIAKVEAGDDKGFRAANRAVFSTPCQDMNLQLREENCRHAYKGSLDAAKALHEAVLHERVYVEIEWSKRYNDEARVTIGLGENGWYAGSGTPARAWLLAILKALHEMETEQ